MRSIYLEGREEQNSKIRLWCGNRLRFGYSRPLEGLCAGRVFVLERAFVGLCVLLACAEARRRSRLNFLAGA